MDNLKKKTKKIASDINNVSVPNFDISFVDVILVGTAKMISGLIKEDPKLYARRISKEYTFGIGFTSTSNILQEIDTNQTFRQYDLKNKPNDDVKDIRSSELSTIMSSLGRLDMIAPSENKKVWKKPGRGTLDNTNSTPSGPKKMYELSRLDKELRETLSDEPTINRIHVLLLKSKLLFRLMRFGKLVSLHVMKINLYDKEKAFRICKSSFLISENKSSFEEDFKFISSIDSVRARKKSI